MTIQTLTNVPNKGQRLLIKQHLSPIILVKIVSVKVNESSTIIALDDDTNFNWQQFLSGTSWVKEAFIIS